MADSRRRLPPQIKRLELASRSGGRPAVRYQLTVDVGMVEGKRKQFRKRYRTEAEARDALDEIRGDVAKGAYVHPSATTVAQACEDWLASKHRLEQTSTTGYDWILAQACTEIGDIEVQKLTRRDVDDLIKTLRAGGSLTPTERKRRPWSARSCNYLLNALSQVLDKLVAEGELVRNVVTLVDRVSGAAQKFKTYTEAEVATVLEHVAEDRNRHAWHLALNGLRRGEISGLRWGLIDFAAETITIGPTRVVAAGKVIDKPAPKSDSGARTLPLPGPLLAELKAARKRQAAEKLALGPAYDDRGYVVCDEAGAPYRPDALSKMWGKTIAAAGVPHIRLQDARHTCGTTMHLQGVPIAVISAWLGHASNDFTMRTYVHSQPDALAEAAQVMARTVTIRDNTGGASGG